MTLNEVETGQCVKVIHVGGQPMLCRRLLDMGVTPGTLIEVLQRGPFQDPLVIGVRSYELAIRNKDAACIEVEVIPH